MNDIIDRGKKNLKIYISLYNVKQNIFCLNIIKI